ncbi:unnamed protein product, partial [Musa textilis]
PLLCVQTSIRFTLFYPFRASAFALQSCLCFYQVGFCTCDAVKISGHLRCTLLFIAY